MKVGIVGCAGRMGQMLVREVLATSGCELCGGTESPGHLALGQDIAARIGLSPCGHDIRDDTPSLFQISDVVIDFTLATITETHTALAAQHGTKLILGTTGHDEQQISSITAAAKKTTIVKAMNFSVGINILLKLTKDIARTVDEEFDIEIVEMHHRHKIDSPSGTAIGLGEAAAAGRKTALPDVANWGRDRGTGKRSPGEIGFASLRGGEVVGEHKVIFAGNSERIELRHTAYSRELFAKGAVIAAKWANHKDTGLYDMIDVLGMGE